MLKCSFCDHFSRFSLSLCVCISVEFANKLVLETIHWCSHLNRDVTWNLLTTLFASIVHFIVHLYGWSQFHIIRRPIENWSTLLKCHEGREHKTFIFYMEYFRSVLFGLWCRRFYSFIIIIGESKQKKKNEVLVHNFYRFQQSITAYNKLTIHNQS